MIDSISLEQFRCFETAELSFLNTALADPRSRLTVFFGENAMGKTSLLEAIHVLLTARSFRSNTLDHLIREDQKSFLLRARLQLPALTSALQPSKLGIEKSARKPPVVSVDGERLRSASKLASILPVQLLNHDSINIVFGEPVLRRRFLDWGVFHVEPRFAALVQGWRQVLAQRNAAIKDAGRRRTVDNGDMVAWTKTYATMSVSIARMRHDYLRELTQFLNDSSVSTQESPGLPGHQRLHQATPVPVSEDITGEPRVDSEESSIPPVSAGEESDRRSTAFGHLDLAGFPRRSISIALKHGFSFEPGASQESNSKRFVEQLGERRDAELSLGRTLSGPGRCDLILRDSQVAVKDHLSRGQGKLLAAQLLLGQMSHLELLRGQLPGVILIDDLYSELDYARADAVIRHATSGRAQVFVSVLASNEDNVPESLKALSSASMFHVEHNDIKKLTHKNTD